MSRNRLSRPRVLLGLSIIAGILFLGAGVGVAIAYPVKGLPVYGKFLLGAVFFVGVIYSFRLEQKGDPIVPRNRGPDEGRDRSRRDPSS